jgi:hypothetical protein
MITTLQNALAKRPLLRVILIAIAVYWLLNRLPLPQAVLSFLFYPFVAAFLYFAYRALTTRQRQQQQLRDAIGQFSQVSDETCVDVCDGSAIALNYAQKTIYLIDGQRRTTATPDDILHWEMHYPASELMKALSGQGDAAALAKKAAIGLATGTTVFGLLRKMVFSRPENGHVKIWLKHTQNNVISVPVSNPHIVDQLQHFSMTHGVKAPQLH